MLTKEICKKCINEWSYREIWKDDCRWAGQNDTNWNNNKVNCPYNTKHSGKAISILIIPDCCIYKMEQLIVGQKHVK